MSVAEASHLHKNQNHLRWRKQHTRYIPKIFMKRHLSAAVSLPTTAHLIRITKQSVLRRLGIVKASVTWQSSDLLR